MRGWPVLALLGGLWAPATEQPETAPSTQSAVPIREVMREEARNLESLVQVAWVRRFLRATEALPPVGPRTVYRRGNEKIFYNPRQARMLPAEIRATLVPQPLDERFYFQTRYGSPLAYARALDLLGLVGVREVQGRRWLDFGYGTIGHLRMLASLGADVVGVDVDPILPALYSEPTDHGTVAGFDGSSAGHLTLVSGRFPGVRGVRRVVGENFDVIISKNTLKNGYVHPAERTDQRWLIQLGVSEPTFIRGMFTALKPGGFLMIYNVCPAPARTGQPYVPWSDGRSPFSREQWEAGGFKVLGINVDDSRFFREHAKALGWDRGPEAVDLEADIFCWYTVLQRPTD